MNIFEEKLTREQYNEYKRNRERAQKALGVKKGQVMHHKDPTLKETDVDRYIQWNTEDLVVMTVAEHNKLHKKDQHLSEGNKTYKPVRCVETGQEFAYVRQVTELTGINFQNVCRAAKYGKTAGGFHWEYI